MADDTEERTPENTARNLLVWAKDTTCPDDQRVPGLSNALYTLSEGGQFEEESISVRTALICHGLIEKLRQAGDLPDEFNL